MSLTVKATHSTTDQSKIIIKKELKDFIVPLAEEERQQLAANIMEQGCQATKKPGVWARPEVE